MRVIYFIPTLTKCEPWIGHTKRYDITNNKGHVGNQLWIVPGTEDCN